MKKLIIDFACYSFAFVLSVLLTTSIVLVVTAARNEHDMEAEQVYEFIEEWRERMPEFEHLHVHMESSTHRVDLHMNNLLEDSYSEERLNQYDHLKYFSNQTVFNLQDLNTLDLSSNMSGQLNVSVTSYVDSELKQRFQIYDIPVVAVVPNVTECSNCSHSYTLAKICIVLSHNNFSIAFQDLGCKGQGLYEWTEGVRDEDSFAIAIEVRSEFDPYVRASWAGLLDLPAGSTELSIIGILILVSSSSCFFFPIVFCISKRKYRYLDLSEIEAPPGNLKVGMRM